MLWGWGLFREVLGAGCWKALVTMDTVSFECFKVTLFSLQCSRLPPSSVFW